MCEESHDPFIEKTVSFVKERMNGNESGHDWSHVRRVWRAALKISRQEGGDPLTISLAALLHDIADHKFSGDLDATGRVAREWLKEIKVDEGVAVHVANIVERISFKSGGVKGEVDTIEGMIVQDADRLDALGAIGIARAFSYGGFMKRKMHDPRIAPFSREPGTTINHFYEKLLLLKDRLHTRTAREMAEERHSFMKSFLDQFLKEWEE